MMCAIMMYELQLDGPGKNALNRAMFARIINQLKLAGGRPILLHGAGSAFCAGLDITEVATLDHDQVRPFLHEFISMLNAVYMYPAPVVAAVNGHAIAGGCLLAMCCDVRVGSANPSIRLGLNEVALGVAFPAPLLALIHQRVPRRHLETVVLGAQLHPPQRSVELGLLDEIADDALEVARERLALLASYCPRAYAKAKAAIRSTLIAGDGEYIADDIAAVWDSEDTRARLLKAIRRRG